MSFIIMVCLTVGLALHPSPLLFIAVWQGVAMDSLKFHPGLPCLNLSRPADGPPLKRPYRAERAVFNPLGHPVPYSSAGPYGKRYPRTP
jgi:hypothetical protein